MLLPHLNPIRGGLLGLGAALLIAISGCGGDDEPSNVEQAKQPDASLPKPQYIRRTDAICRDYHPRLRDLQDEIHAAAERHDLDAVADRLQAALDLTRTEFSKLRAIPRPKRDRAVIASLFDKANQTIRLYESSMEPLRNEDSERFITLASKARSAAHREQGIATDYGFKVCGQD